MAVVVAETGFGCPVAALKVACASEEALEDLDFFFFLVVYTNLKHNALGFFLLNGTKRSFLPGIKGMFFS